MKLGSLSRLFILRLIGNGPITQSDLIKRAERADVTLDFGFGVELDRYLRSLVGEGLIEVAPKSRFRVTPLGAQVLKEVVDSRIDDPVRAALEARVA